MRCRVFLAVALVASAAWGGACRRSPAGRSQESPDERPNVLLITTDTTRADRLGCYGYADAQTPALDALATSGVRCAQAFCQVPLTLPSHVSLMTSTDPPSNGIHVNGGSVLGDTLPTLAGTFKDHGYRTGAFVGAWVLNAGFGLSRGFDHYDDNLGDEDTAGLYSQRSGEEVCDAALAWLGQHAEAPFFAWVHFFDPHRPYTPPSPFREKLADPYDGEIAFMDTQIARLMDWLEARDLRQRTLIVVAGDHGEAFGERGEMGHGLFLYGQTMHVPLIFSWPGRLPQGGVLPGGVRLIDVAPTIVALMGWKTEADWQGQSLREMLETGSSEFLPAYGETEYPAVGFGWASLRSYTTGRWKYVDAPRPELYDRVADPAERSNVIAQHPDVAADLKEELATLLAGLKRSAVEPAALTDEELSALQSLGYVGGSGQTTQPNDRGPRRDPKDMANVYRGVLKATYLAEYHRYAEVVQLLEPLAAQSPESDELRGILAEAYLNLGRLAEAEREYRASLRTVPTNPRKLCRLGDALLGQGKTAEAVECYKRAGAPPHEYGPALGRLGAVYLKQKRFAEAEQCFRRRLELSPDLPNAMTNLANVLPHVGRQAEAIELLRRALQHDPKFAPAHRFLWQLLAGSGRRVEAIDALRAACQALPADWSLRRELAGMLATTPQAGPGAAREAVTLAQQCCEAEPDSADSFAALAVAQEAVGDLVSAAEAARRALSLAERQGRTDLVPQLRARLALYEAGQR